MTLSRVKTTASVALLTTKESDLTIEDAPLTISMSTFSPYHTLPLFIGTALGVGGLMPFWNPAGAIREFGLPERFAISQPVQQSFVISGARVSVLGAATWIFYLQGNLAAVDTIMSLMLWVGAVDGYVCWREGVPSKALMRAASGLIIGGWGMLGLSQK